MDYARGQRQIVLNFSEKFCQSEVEVLESECFKDVWGGYVKSIYKANKIDFVRLLDLVENPANDFIELYKMLLSLQVKEIMALSDKFDKVLENQETFYDLIEHFYDYWRRIERYGVVFSRNNSEAIDAVGFMTAQSQFTNLILRVYRTISEKVSGKKFSVYRQLPAGINVGLMLTRHKWMSDNSPYAFLARSEAIDKIIIRPPFISYSDKNKRTGIYQEVYENPIYKIKDFNAKEYYCYAAHVGGAIAYVYFHRDYLAHGITIGNLFDFIPVSELKDKKPDLLYIFGAQIEGDSIFYHDKENGIYVGVAPHNSSIDYFGYMKKMLLTLYNVSMIDQGNLPIHGACVSITMQNGTVKNVVIIGDSGAGKSESLEALAEMAGDNISNQLTVFDDMGTFKIVDGKLKAYGTEIGAFVRLDDMTSGYAYREMDRAIFMNPDKVNSRLVVPVATHKQIMKGYDIDMVLYANNFEPVTESLKFFKNKDEALKVFVRGARKAKGTTQEIGLVESFFANPFGPVQRQEQTTKILDTMFGKLFNDGITVGELYTQLAVPGMEHEGPKQAATQLFKLLED